MHVQAQALSVQAVDDVEVEDAEHFDAIRVRVQSDDPGYAVIDFQQVVRVADNDMSLATKPVDRWGGQVYRRQSKIMPAFRVGR
eukprot:scaffold594233_cov37-Prasinocladus_malaysianus.AAC.1